MVQQKKISHKQLVKIHHHPALVAGSLNLVYINDGMEGIRRFKKGKGYYYKFKDELVKVIQILEKLSTDSSFRRINNK